MAPEADMQGGFDGAYLLEERGTCDRKPIRRSMAGSLSLKCRQANGDGPVSSIGR
jgi:hypothetical protein